MMLSLDAWSGSDLIALDIFDENHNIFCPKEPRDQLIAIEAPLPNSIFSIPF